ncbi:MAG: CRISPR system precrRNA processing endoribonuclease RAMP protein Cas6, partial [Anaerolineae bacterium]|nr:CRISPR system precrRNA processing endoribonuclease RAMP protein Cas6 [Anaerolineae bacterium]
HFTAHRLTFVTTAQEIVELNEHQGSALRGALFHALRHKFCAFARYPNAECSTCALAQTCPVATLVSTLDPTHTRGQDRPRPFSVQPPIMNGEWRKVRHESPMVRGHYWEREDGSGVFRYEPGEPLVFGLTLYANAMQLFPYVVLALQDFEQGGLGRQCEQYDGRWRRGRLAVREVWAENPLTAERRSVLREGERLVRVPDVPVTHEQVMAYGKRMMEREPASVLTLYFLTPTRLVEDGRLLKPPMFRFRPFFQRLLERLESLSEAFCDTPLPVDFPALLAEAETVQVVERALWWDDVCSYSTRRRAESPIGGLVGRVTLEARDWSPFLPWLLWGQFTHVGKDAVKGNGWYEVEGRE